MNIASFLIPEFTVFLVNIGMRKRGWCGHWAQDIGARLIELNLKTLVLHWGVAYDHTSSENNCLVVTARNQPFQDGIILDGWRRAGRLFWCPVIKDDEYEMNSTTATPASPCGEKTWNGAPGCRIRRTPKKSRKQPPPRADFYSLNCGGSRRAAFTRGPA